MEEAVARRGRPGPRPDRSAGYYESAFRVIGRYIDEQKPRDVFFFEQDGAFVVRLLAATQAGSQHELAEFTRTTSRRSSRGPALRNPAKATGAGRAAARPDHRPQEVRMRHSRPWRSRWGSPSRR